MDKEKERKIILEAIERYRTAYNAAELADQLAQGMENLPSDSFYVPPETRQQTLRGLANDIDTEIDEIRQETNKKLGEEK